MLKVQHIDFTYPNSEKIILKDLSFEVEAGQTCAILGKNGSGKTTLIKCLAGILTPDAGEVDISKPVGYVPQKVNFVYDMKVLDTIVMGRYQYIGAFSLPKKEDYEIAKECAARLEITHLLDQSFSQLSGGQQQMAIVARALAVGSDCIIFDEPCSALDFGNQNKILSIISQVSHKNITSIFSTHDPNHALHIADKVLIMMNEHRYIFGDTAEILSDEALSSLYGMPLQKIKVSDQLSAIIALYD